MLQSCCYCYCCYCYPQKTISSFEMRDGVIPAYVPTPPFVAAHSCHFHSTHTFRIHGQRCKDFCARHITVADAYLECVVVNCLETGRRFPFFLQQIESFAAEFWRFARVGAARWDRCSRIVHSGIESQILVIFALSSPLSVEPIRPQTSAAKKADELGFFVRRHSSY